MRRILVVAVTTVLAAVALSGCASSWVEGDQPGEEGYEASPFRTSYGDENYGNGGYGGVGSVERQMAQCLSDTRTLKTAIVVWNTEYLGGDPNYRTPWPTSMAQLTEPPTELLQEESTLHRLKAVDDGDSPPLIVTREPCEDEVIVQLN